METVYTKAKLITHLNSIKPVGYSLNSDLFYEKAISNGKVFISCGGNEHFPHSFIFSSVTVWIRFNNVVSFKEQIRLTLLHKVPYIYVQPEEGDRIFFVKRKINISNNKLQTIVKQFTFPASTHNQYNLIKNGLDYTVVNKVTTVNQNFDFINTLPNYTEQPHETNLKSIPANSIYLDLYYQYIIVNRVIDPGQSQTREWNANEIEYIESITLLFNQIFSLDDFVQKLNDYNFLILFESYFNNFQSLVNSNPDISSTEYYQTYTKEYFELFYVRLQEFYKMAKIFNSVIHDDTYLLTWIVGLLGHHGIKNLSYDKKLKLLETLLIKGLKDDSFFSGRWNPLIPKYKLTVEELVVNIIKSFIRKDNNNNIVYNEINMFMDVLISETYFEKIKTNGDVYYRISNYIEEYYPFDAVFTGLGLSIRFNEVEQIMHQVANNVNFNIHTQIGAPTLKFDFSKNILGDTVFFQMRGIKVHDDASFNMVRPYLDQLMNATLTFINQYPTLLSLHNYIEAFTPQERANIYCTPPATRIIIKKLVGQPYTDIANTLIQGLNQRGDTEEANYYQALKTHLDNL